jgi:hypothetical protein
MSSDETVSFFFFCVLQSSDDDATLILKYDENMFVPLDGERERKGVKSECVYSFCFNLLFLSIDKRLLVLLRDILQCIF